MSQLKLNVTPDQISSISTPEVLYIIKTIKQIQKRMKDPDMTNIEYIRVYDKLSHEFDDFFNRYTGIFAKVTKGEDLSVLASALYYKDQVAKGLISEADLSNKLAETYLPKKLKDESDMKIKSMKNEGII